MEGLYNIFDSLVNATSTEGVDPSTANNDYEELIACCTSSDLSLAGGAMDLLPQLSKYYPSFEAKTSAVYEFHITKSEGKLHSKALRSFPKVVKTGGDLMRQHAFTFLITQLHHKEMAGLFDVLLTAGDENTDNGLKLLNIALAQVDVALKKKLIGISIRHLREVALKMKDAEMQTQFSTAIQDLVKSKKFDGKEQYQLLKLLRVLNMYSGKEGATSLMSVFESLTGLNESDAKLECCITNIPEFTWCLKAALNLFKSGSASPLFFTYVKHRVLPYWESIEDSEALANVLDSVVQFLAMCDISYGNRQSLIPVVYELLKSKIATTEYKSLEAILYSLHFLAFEAITDTPRLINVVFEGSVSAANDSTGNEDIIAVEQPKFVSSCKLLKETTVTKIQKMDEDLKTLNADKEKDEATKGAERSKLRSDMRIIRNIVTLVTPLTSDTPKLIKNVIKKVNLSFAAPPANKASKKQNKKISKAGGDVKGKSKGGKNIKKRKGAPGSAWPVAKVNGANKKKKTNEKKGGK